MRRVNLLFLLVVVLCPLSSAAQQGTDLVGRRVRVRAPALSINDNNATLMHWYGDSITVSLTVPVVTPAAGGFGLDPATLASPARAKVWAPDFSLEGAEVELSPAGSGLLHFRSKHFSLQMPVSAITRLQILDGDGQRVTLPLGSVESVAVYEGRKSAGRIGAVVGLIAGVVGGVAAVHAMRTSCSPELSTGAYAAGATLGGLVGAGLGASIGSAIRWDHWKEIRAHAFRVAPVARGSEFGFVASVSF